MIRCLTTGLFVVAVTAVCAGSAQADLAKVSDANEFKSLVSGKTLTRPLVKLRVAPEGRISGKGAAWDVTGSWQWRDGYFCRDLNWGGSELGYNCQEVAAGNGRIRFTSDRGRGESADFNLKND